MFSATQHQRGSIPTRNGVWWLVSGDVCRSSVPRQASLSHDRPFVPQTNSQAHGCSSAHLHPDGSVISVRVETSPFRGCPRLQRRFVIRLLVLLLRVIKITSCGLVSQGENGRRGGSAWNVVERRDLRSFETRQDSFSLTKICSVIFTAKKLPVRVDYSYLVRVASDGVGDGRLLMLRTSTSQRSDRLSPILIFQMVCTRQQHESYVRTRQPYYFLRL